VKSILNRKLILLTSMTLSILISPMISSAKGYQFGYEVFAAYNHSEDESDLFETDQYQAGISIFDKTVGYGDYPYLLTNFFERRTHLDLNYIKSEFDSADDETTGDIYAINYSFASVGSPILFDIGASRLVGEGTDVFGDYEVDATTYIFGFGYYITPNSVAAIKITAADYIISDDISGNIDYDETRLQATWQHVLKTGPENYIAVLLDVEAIELGSSKNSNVGGTFDYYVSRKAAFGFGYTAHRGDYGVTEGDSLSLRASGFMDKQFGFVAEIERLFADISGADEDNIYIKAIARFN